VIEEVIRIAVEAGGIIQAAYREGLHTKVKEGNEPVTQADREADAYLRRSLEALVPAGWLSEESADDLSRLQHSRVWVVDPLDGTKEFIRGLPEYAVSIALVEDGRPILGLIHNPTTEDTFWSCRGEGTFRNGTRLRVRESRVLLASRTEVDEGEFEPFRDSWTVRPCGSIAYKLALVSAGEGAGTLSRGPKREWDVCAGSMLVEEAGGVVTDALGAPLRFNRAPPRTSGVLAAAPRAHRLLLSAARKVGMADRPDVAP